MSVNVRRVEAAVRELLEAIGEDVEREGLRETPGRVARFWREFIDHEPGKVDTVFESASTDQMVVVSGMRVWSLCEHHLMPFWCDVAVGYVTADRVLGLSKFARIAHRHAHKLQIQERLAEDIATEVSERAGSEDVAVLCRGEHLCMTARGVRTEALMTSSVVRGRFRTEAPLRAEFMAVANGGRGG